jgi:hypothetical protein
LGHEWKYYLWGWLMDFWMINMDNEWMIDG